MQKKLLYIEREEKNLIISLHYREVLGKLTLLVHCAVHQAKELKGQLNFPALQCGLVHAWSSQFSLVYPDSFLSYIN